MNRSSGPPAHKCQPPVITYALTRPQQPDWECGACGRLWRDWITPTGIGWWAEIRGPRAGYEELAARYDDRPVHPRQGGPGWSDPLDG